MQLKNQFGKISQSLMIGLLLLITFLIALGIWFSSKDKPPMNMRMPNMKNLNIRMSPRQKKDMPRKVKFN